MGGRPLDLVLGAGDAPTAVVAGDHKCASHARQQQHEAERGAGADAGVRPAETGRCADEPALYACRIASARHLDGFAMSSVRPRIEGG